MVRLNAIIVCAVLLCHAAVADVSILTSNQLYEDQSASCSWTLPINSLPSIQPEVYWINMKTSVERRINMQKHLSKVGLSNFRVEGVSMDDLFIPEDIDSGWNNQFQALFNSAALPVANISHKYVMSSIFGRKKTNRLKVFLLFHAIKFFSSLLFSSLNEVFLQELGCTMSHLMAIRQAVFSTTAKSRFALIIEDDVQIPFAIDYQALAESAPPGFGILQLFNSCEGTMKLLWERYVRNSKSLWQERTPQQAIDFWYQQLLLPLL